MCLAQKCSPSQAEDTEQSRMVTTHKVEIYTIRCIFDRKNVQFLPASHSFPDRFHRLHLPRLLNKWDSSVPSPFDLGGLQVPKRLVCSRWASGGGAAAACYVIHPQGMNSFPL